MEQAAVPRAQGLREAWSERAYDPGAYTICLRLQGLTTFWGCLDAYAGPYQPS